MKRYEAAREPVGCGGRGVSVGRERKGRRRGGDGPPTRNWVIWSLVRFFLRIWGKGSLSAVKA